jgi:hypothetical protein
VTAADKSPKQSYAEATRIVEAALAEAARAQWAGDFPDLHRARRTLIELRRSVPNDRLDPANQVVRDLLTVYATVLEEQGQRNAYERDQALSAELRAELERLRPRAARHGLPVLADDLRGFRVGRERPVAPPAPRARPARPAPAAAASGAAKPKRRRRRSRRGRVSEHP